MGTFGEKFREERERRGFTLDDISNATKISSRMLQAIEQEKFTLLPGGVFNKGFVRAYAKHLGLNPEQAIAEYLTALRQSQVDEQTASWEQPAPPKPSSAPKGPKPPADPKLAEPDQHSSSLNWTNARHAGKPAVPLAPFEPSAPQNTGSPKSPSLRAAALQPSPQESPIPQPLVQPPPTPLPSPNRSDLTDPASSRNSPPPLWIPPSAVAKSPFPKSASPNASVPPSPIEATAPPSTSKPSSFQPSPLTVGPAPLEAKPEQTQPERSHLPAPEILLPMPQPLSRSTKAQVLEPTPRLSDQPPASTPSWKIPALILTAAAIVIAALLFTRHSHSTAIPAPATMNSTASATPRSTPPAAPPPSIASAKIGKPLPANSPAHSSPAAKFAPLPSSHATAQASAAHPFHLTIRATENCAISITADGELLARENLIAPANTTVKATREIVIQVSNAAAVTFRVNDHMIQSQGAEAESKTLVFDSNGLRTPGQ